MGLRNRVRGGRTPQDAFAEEVARIVAELESVEKVERGDDFSLEISMADGMPRVMYLQNIYAEAARLDRDARDALLRRAVLAITTTVRRPLTWAEAEPRLMPSLRAAGWAAASASGERSPMRQVFAPFVFVMLAIDDEHGMSFVTEEDARSWGVDWAEAADAAATNLARTPVQVGAPPGAPWLDVLGPDGYVSSWLAIPRALEHFAEGLGGDFVAVAKSRDSLRLIATADVDVVAAQLERVLGEYLSEPRQLSPVPFVVRDGELGLWDPPADHPCRALVERLHRILALNEYGLQMKVLSDLFRKAGEDLFVAKYTLMEREDKTVWSWAAWPRAVTDGLLPQTDYLCLSDLATNTSVWVRWEDAEHMAPEALFREPGYYPPRWRVRGWPDEQVMAGLRACAVDPATGLP